MKTDKEFMPVEVFAGTQWEASMVKSLLENAEIESFLKDEMIGTLNPWHATPGGVNPIKVFVSSVDVDKALIVIKEYEKNLKNEQ
jgi:hypothetical protein